MLNVERVKINLLPDILYALNDLKGLLKDIALISILPLAIIAATTLAMYLPADAGDILKLNVHSPSLWQFYTSSFMHVDMEHYLNNMSVFALLMALQVLLAAKLKEGRRFTLLLLAALLIVPPLAASFELFYAYMKVPIYSMTNYGCGSSALVSAVFGFSPAIVLGFLSKKAGKNLYTPSVFFMLAIYILFMFCFIYYPYIREIPLTVASGLLLVLFTSLTLYSAIKNRALIKDEIRDIAKDYFKNILYNSSAIILALMFLNAPFQLFPTSVVTGGSWINFLSHFVGIVIGYTLAYNFFYRMPLPKG